MGDPSSRRLQSATTLGVEESNALEPDPRLKDTRRVRKIFFLCRRLSGKFTSAILSNNYDFISSRVGIQPFVSDFRGFIFNDSNLGVRIFGNYDNNRWQYNRRRLRHAREGHLFGPERIRYDAINRSWSRMSSVRIFLRKDTRRNSTFVANFDGASRHFDKNDFITRPAPIGDGARSLCPGLLPRLDRRWTHRTAQHHACFLSGVRRRRFQRNRRPARRINAQMAALELSIDKDWLRYKLSVFYASGDDDPTGLARPRVRHRF